MSDSQKGDRGGPGRRWPVGSVASWPKILMELESQSVHDWVYASLRHMILYNIIKPGEWLRQKDVSAQFQVSRTPVREAFRTLKQEGLVTIVPNYGARVSQLSKEEFEEIYALRIGIEGLAARITAQRATPEQLRSLRAQLASLEQLVEGSDLFQYLKQEWQFRIDCYQLTGRARLIERVIFLREHSERYIYLAYNAKTKVSESFNFHCRLLAAFEEHEAAQAEAIIQEALRWTLKNAGTAVSSILT
ncbi:MAG: hypothetical protein DCF25_13655 [Leptolyngbya foveolarum]|uniref:HTH gntR-type domain-containing protein n=1 Tax=Leptolyngbya foveolarum TaxID=47253 RepID=A0A2W4U5H4_9CYAN|nr:MAG: hypothetical protein DCF25_13655 [Leptolyngbya foveolarum]